jgi:transketolase
VLAESDGAKPRAIVVASGSETGLALEARALLAERGVPVRVVSMPCVERFEVQPEAYRRAVLPPAGRVVVIEAARTDLWAATVGPDALRLGINRYGASAPAGDLAEHLGFTPDAVANRIAGWLRDA